MNNMVINTYSKLIAGTHEIGTILNIEERFIPVNFLVLEEISQEQYLQELSETEFAYTIEYFRPHPNLKFYKIEVLPD